MASEKKQPVKVVLKEKEYDKANGEIGISYSTMAVENLSINKDIKLLDLVDKKEKQVDKSKDDYTY